MISSVVGVSSVLLALAGGALSQGTNANCSAKFDWASNDRQQDICLITAYLRSACLADPTDAYVNALPGPTYYYVQPTLPDKCTCSMVYYNTISACALCQGGETTPWSGYITNCTSDEVTKAGFPDNIPLGTDVPAWAYLDVSLTDNFNVTQALDYSQLNGTFVEGQTPTSSALPSSTSSSVFFSSSAATNSAATSAPAESTTAPAVTSSSHKSNAGAIAGGVVGGVAGVALIAFALLFWQRRRTHTAKPGMAIHDAEPTLIGQMSPPVSPGPIQTGSVGRLYNPDDPTTFPKTHGAPDMGYAYGRDSSVMSTGMTHPTGYTGAAEL
ncbi:hypothetical protein PsYK624_106690 [Phanerochaete sordida]|uniref:Transmembrane protein n=1 Tax=Phanerochaete sordida TaxID=48140 RepID=A0A9P3GHP7_9APHY|nr:hypothetical protein PsYK624_106690 [Phanerochaete sordida]